MNKLLIFMASVIFSTPLLCEVELSSYVEGSVSYIDYKTREIVVDDTSYKLSAKLKVVGSNNKRESIFSIKNGSYVRLLTGGGDLENSSIKTVQFVRSKKSNEDEELNDR